MIYSDEIATALENTEGWPADGDKPKLPPKTAGVFFIGNGGSAAIASHMAADWTKNGGYRALAFNDGAALTCLSNDFGYERSFSFPIGRFGHPGDWLFAISSSGESQNIIEAASTAKSLRMNVVTLSGFNPNNRLRQIGDTNYYVPSSRYGIVEISHLAILHELLDSSMEVPK